MKKIIVIITLLVLLSVTLIICSSPTSPNSTVWVNPTGYAFHKSSCSYVNSGAVSMSRETAINRGYSACKRCKP